MTETEALIIAFRRDDALRRTLQALSEQSMMPKTITVWDNDNSRATEQVVATEGKRFPDETLKYVASVDNVGPAGALSSHLATVCALKGPEAWVIRVDDDADLTDSEELRNLLDLAVVATDANPLTAAVGLRGATFDHKRATLSAATTLHANGLIEVDTLHGGYVPMFKVGPSVDVGGFNADFFFGFEELDFGLRLRRSGYKQYAAPGYLDRNPISFVRSSPKFLAETPGWRQYYSMRNLVVIARMFATKTALLEVVIIRGFAKPLANLFVRPRVAVKLLRVNRKAIADALRNRTGRQLEPDAPHAETDFYQKS
ncbi:MAG: glycosyltransferase family 2 protein [Acidimicrobiales bacterium]|jgi:GT2 family glycosyltransferase